MSINSDTRLVEASTSEREVEFLRRLVEEQRKLIEKLNKQLLNQKERIEQLEAELLAKKKLKGKPKLSASLLNQADVKEAKAEKRAGSAKRREVKNLTLRSMKKYRFSPILFLRMRNSMAIEATMYKN